MLVIAFGAFVSSAADFASSAAAFALHWQQCQTSSRTKMEERPAERRLESKWCARQSNASEISLPCTASHAHSQAPREESATSSVAPSSSAQAIPSRFSDEPYNARDVQRRESQGDESAAVEHPWRSMSAASSTSRTHNAHCEESYAGRQS